MRVMAFSKIPVRDAYGFSDGKSYIAAGDLCTVTDKTLAGLYPVTYPTARGSKTRWLRQLEGFLCNQNDYAYLSYAAPAMKVPPSKAAAAVFVPLSTPWALSPVTAYPCGRCAIWQRPAAPAFRAAPI